MLIAVIYGYIGFTYLFFQFFELHSDDDFVLALFYFILSCAAVIYFLLNYHKWTVRKEPDQPPGRSQITVLKRGKIPP
jgi:hypothetical protein